MSSEILLVKKSDYKSQATVAVGQAPSPPHELCTRVRPRLLGLGKPNPFYIMAGGIFSFWNAFPVPQALHTSHDPEVWCTPKAWGYAEVVASAVTGVSIPPGTLIFGWWPISSAENDVTLEEISGSPGHFIETSRARGGLMSLYNHYYIPKGEASAWMAAVFMSWGTSHLLCEYSFPPILGHLEQAVHPGGNSAGAWDAGDADLRSTLVIGLSVSSKTGRSFSWGMRQPRQNTPLAYLEVSTSGMMRGTSPTFETKGATYEELLGDEVVNWAAGTGAKRILVVDFGARGDLATRLLERFSARFDGNVSFTFVAIGANPEIMRDDGLSKKMAKGQSLRKVQGNHSGVQESAEQAVGAAQVLERWMTAFEAWKSSEDAEGYSIVESRGRFDSSDGIARGWEHLYGGEKTQTDTAYAFWL